MIRAPNIISPIPHRRSITAAVICPRFWVITVRALNPAADTIGVTVRSVSGIVFCVAGGNGGVAALGRVEEGAAGAVEEVERKLR
jgi:hypothetical protein